MPSASPAKATRKRPGRYHHGDLHQALIQAAVRTIDRRGVEALTLRAVGASLGVSRTALYRHFADKDSLLAAVAAEGFVSFQASLAEAWQAAGGGLAGLGAMGRAYVAYGTAHRSHYRVMFGGYQACVPQESDLQRAGDDAFAVLVDALAELRTQGLIRDDDPLVQAHFVWSAVHGAVMLTIAGVLGSDPSTGDALARYTSERIVAALVR